MKKNCETHCDHLIDRQDTDTHFVANYICCHCGEQRQERIERRNMNKYYHYDESEHGPYAPTFITRFGW